MNGLPESRCGRHVLLIILPKSPRALWGSYGSFANLTPHLDEFGAHGVVLDRCLLATSDPKGETCSDWPQQLIETLSAKEEVEVAEVGIAPEACRALEDLEEFQDEILDQILEAGEKRQQSTKPYSVMVVRIPDVPLAMFPFPEEDLESDDLDEDDFDDEEIDSSEEDLPPAEFPHAILPIEQQIDWERIISWQDRFFPEVIAEWENSIGDLPRLVVVTTEAGSGFPFVCDDAESKTLEMLYRVPCLLKDSKGHFEGTRLGAMTSITDLAALLPEWMMSPDLQATGPEQTWWSLLRLEVESLYQRLYRRTPEGELLVWYPDAFLVHGEHPQVYFKPEDQADLDNIAPEQPLLLERLLAEMNRPVAD